MSYSISTTHANPTVEAVEDYDTEPLINFLQTKNLNLNSDDYKKLRNERVAGLDFLQLTREKLCAEPYRFSDGSARRIITLISELNNPKLLTLEEALLCVPPPVPLRRLSRSILNSGGYVPDDILLWDDFFESVNQYKFTDEKRYPRPQFWQISSVQGAFEFNIWGVLNNLLGPEYEFSKENTNYPGDPDFTCFFVQSILLFPIEIIEIKLLETEEKQFPELYETSVEARAGIKQIFNYMVENERQYGVLSTYNKHWFLCRPKNNPKKLWISETLSLESESPLVLKAYAYMAQKLCSYSNDSYFSPHVLKIQESVTGKDEGSVSKHMRSLRSRTKSSSNNSSGLSSSKISQKDQKGEGYNQNFSFMDFKFNGMLGQGRSGKTLKCEFQENTIALKCTDLWKFPPYILKEMQNEVKIYQILSTIQGECIPKLMCYGYYGDGMCYVIGTSFVGTSLTNYKHITEQQRIMGLYALNTIHSKGVLHNDIRGENILLNNMNDNVYLIDFGLASYHHDVKKHWELFNKEKRELVHLLDHYTLLDSVVII